MQVKTIPFSVTYFLLKCCMSGPKTKSEIYRFCQDSMKNEITVSLLTQNVSDGINKGLVIYKNSGAGEETKLQSTPYGKEVLENLFNQIKAENKFIVENKS